MATRPIILSSLFLSMLLCAAPRVAPAAPPLGRVSELTGAAHASGAFEDEWTGLTLNYVVGERDAIYTEGDAYLEIELRDDAWLRLAPDTSGRLQRLGSSRIEVALEEGSMSLSTTDQDGRIGARSSDVDIAERSRVRVDADASGDRIVVSVAEGLAELRTPDGQRSLSAGERVAWMRGWGFWREEGGPTEDEFDRWCEMREHVAREAAFDERLPHGMVGASVLRSHGSWVRLDDGWAWQPWGLSASWRPYYDGYWQWLPGWGWSFVPAEPWGYVTCHYGRWRWNPSIGWCWVPDGAWSSAWVTWIWVGVVVGWAPCDFYGHPVYRHHDRHHDPDVWSSCDRDYFRQGGGHDGGWHRPSSGETVPSGPMKDPLPRTIDRRSGVGLRGSFSIKPLDLADSTAAPVVDPGTALRPERTIRSEVAKPPKVGGFGAFASPRIPVRRAPAESEPQQPATRSRTLTEPRTLPSPTTPSKPSEKTPPSVAPTAKPWALPPASTPRTLPPASTPRTLPPASTPRTLPPASTPRTLPPATTPRTLPPATTPRTLPPASTPSKSPPAVAPTSPPRTLSPATRPAPRERPSERSSSTTPEDANAPATPPGKSKKGGD